MNLNLLALEAALDEPRDVRVLGREHAIERLEQHDLASEACEAGGDLRPGGARADYRQARRHLLQRPRLLGADDATAELDPGNRTRDRAGREDHRPRGERFAVDADGPISGQRGIALDQLDRRFS